MKKTFQRKIWSFLKSIKLTVFVLILLALTSVLGTLIPQNQSAEVYIKLYKPSIASLISALNLDDMYRAWWFRALILLFTMNLVSCTLSRLSALLRLLKKEQIPSGEHTPAKPHFRKSFFIPAFDDSIRKKIRDVVRNFFHTPTAETFSPDSLRLFSEKGKWSRFSFYITHTGILWIIAGAVASGFGFRGSMTLVEGEASNIVTIRNSTAEKRLDFTIRCDDFETTYYKNTQQPKDYKSRLTIVENGKDVLSKTIEVNDPLKYRGVVIYQSSCGTIPELDKINLKAISENDPRSTETFQVGVGDTFRLNDNRHSASVKRFIPDFTINEKREIVNRSDELRNPAIQVSVSKDGDPLYEEWVFLHYPDFHGSHEGEFRFVFEGFATKEYTGLQLTQSPGLWSVWVGCLFLIAGSCLIFFSSHSRVWIVLDPDKRKYRLTLSAMSSRNRIAFQRKFEQLSQAVEEAAKNAH
ncbi:MAG: cytochrome c biogenesis protein ResB [bacterium]